jgi:hypothetical protein
VPHGLLAVAAARVLAARQQQQQQELGSFGSDVSSQVSFISCQQQQQQYSRSSSFLSTTGPDLGHFAVARSGRSSISCLAADAGSAAAAAAGSVPSAVGIPVLVTPAAAVHQEAAAAAAAGTEGIMVMQRPQPVVLQATGLQLPLSHPLLLSPTSDGGCSDAFRCGSAVGSVRSSVELAAVDASPQEQQQQQQL